MRKLILSIAILTVAIVFAKNENPSEILKNDIVNYTLNVNAFCKLIQLGNYDAVKSLINEGEDINRKSTGLTPLMFAARYNKVEIAKLLIENGANLKEKSDRKGFTALKWAELSNAKETYQVIYNAISGKKNHKKKKIKH